MLILTWTQIERIFTEKEQGPDIFSGGSAVTIGSFDGPHMGHEVLFNAVCEASRSNGYAPGVITFTHSVGEFKRPESYEGDLSTLAQRLDVFREKGMAFTVVIDFSAEFSKMKGQDFFYILRKSCGLKFLAEGKDFRCGYRGTFGMKEILDYSVCNGITAQFPEPVLYGSSRISSSLIRSCIIRGDFSSAAKMLGHNYTLDCSETVWKCEDSQFTAERHSFLQALPADGTYDVVAILPESRIHLSLSAEPHFLRLEVPYENTLSCIKAVEFI
ncbi:MAG: riboflavin biosynthesis protein [Treponema sp.]|nr:riboflavin biosynthesis protein [Treponema sp.]